MKIKDLAIKVALYSLAVPVVVVTVATWLYEERTKKKEKLKANVQEKVIEIPVQARRRAN